MPIRRSQMNHLNNHRGAAKALIASLAGVFMAATGPSYVTASIRISADSGGPMGQYMKMFLQIRESGQNVIIDGDCLSACTLVLALIPHDRICVTPKARLGFHATSSPDDHINPSASNSITQALMELYPPPVSKWISQRGGLKKNMIFLTGPELMTMYRTCPFQQ